ncbi:MAG: PP2C family protein-serine/threonine phosphatase [Eubacterium sp.]
MNYIISATTDVGIRKKTNQDSLSVKIINTNQGRMAFAILCDGMGGLQKGEVASAAVIHAFNQWVTEELPSLCNGPIQDHVIREQWCEIITSMNEKIKNYGNVNHVQLGTTAVVMLITEKRYYILNVGDSRAYEIWIEITQLTKDQTFVERQVSLGNMTREQAEQDSRKNILLQCVGASPEVYPEMFFGDTKKDAVYMLCSDGFRHEITPEEIYAGFNPGVLLSKENMQNNAIHLININKQRQENDNISVALIRTF